MTDPARAPLERLPHVGPARLISSVASIDAGGIVCEGRVGPGGPYDADGRCASYVCLEVAAQATALIEALDPACDATRPRVGYLVRVRHLRLARPDFAAGEPLRASARRIASVPPLFIYAVEVADGSGELLSGEIATFVPLDQDTS